jgi:hypothetical protein
MSACKLCEATQHKNHDNVTYDSWLAPQNPSWRFEEIAFGNGLGGRRHAILSLGEHPHIHGLYKDFIDLSGNNIYTLEAEIENIAHSKNSFAICPLDPVAVSIGAMTVQRSESQPKTEPNRIGIQQRVIAYNQKCHARADAAKALAPEFILPDLWRIVIDYAIMVPIGPRLTLQVVPTFCLNVQWYDAIQNKYSDEGVLNRLKELFLEFYWYTPGSAPRGYWKRGANKA